jgi:hypothetical protein
MAANAKINDGGSHQVRPTDDAPTSLVFYGYPVELGIGSSHTDLTLTLAAAKLDWSISFPVSN